MTTARVSFATRASASVEGPGIGSARSKLAWSSVWQKYCERKSSGRQITCAPALAASRTRATARSRLSRGSVEQRIWTRPRVKVCGGAMRPTILGAPANASDVLRRPLIQHLPDDVAQQAIPDELGVGVEALG